MGDGNQLSFSVNENVLCFHGPLLYEAKVLKAEYWDESSNQKSIGPHYFIHYKGWKDKWDDWVPETRLLKLNDENMARKKALESSHKPQPKKQTTEPKKKRDSIAVQETSKVEMMKLPIPDSLKAVLVDDWENVTRNHYLIELPASLTIEETLSRYRQWVDKTKPFETDDKDALKQVVEEVTDGIMSYFNLSIGCLLLYSQERVQYKEILARKKESSDVEILPRNLCDVYGPHHLLRLMTKLPEMIAKLPTPMKPETVALLKDHFLVLIRFLHMNEKEFFSPKHYCNASPEQLHLSKGISA